MKTPITAVLLLTILISGCKVENTPDNFDYGKVEGSKYVNSYFDLEMDVPAD